MPRGVYDRSAMKARRAAEKTGQAPTAPAAKPGKRGAAKKAMAKTSAVGAVAYSQTTAPHDLYNHLANLYQARQAINSNAAGHNEKLLSVLDAEIADTITSLRLWRESRFPTSYQKEDAAPAQASAPAPVQGNAGVVPPLPFTPATAHEVVKNAGVQ